MTDLDDAKDIIDNSGNSFHSKVTKSLEENGWRVLISPYYMDYTTNKPREIDLIAEKPLEFETSMRNTRRSCLNIRLFIECKYIPLVTVFWFADKDINSARKLVISDTPLTEDSIPLHNTPDGIHHYLSDNKVAKLFSSSKKGDKKTENESMYLAINQSLNAMVYHNYLGSIITHNENYKYVMSTTVEMPIILCNNFDKFYRVEMDDQSTPTNITDAFQLEINYAYSTQEGRKKSKYFLLDVFDYSKFNEFLDVIEKDTSSIIESMRHKAMDKAIEEKFR